MIYGPGCHADEIDAIGLERMPNPFDDPGQTEREKGLMQMMVEMDGFGVEEGDGVRLKFWS